MTSTRATGTAWPPASILALAAACLACQPPPPEAPSRRSGEAPPLAAAQVAPIIDGDGDGIPDAEDACPAEAGMRDADPRKSGCRPADTDGDGVIDARDRCPSQPVAETADRDHELWILPPP